MGIGVLDDFSKEIMSTIKKAASAKGYTQQSLALALNVSLPTLKRWLGGRGVSLEVLKRLADHVGLSISEIASMVENVSPTKFQYSDEQEEYFSHYPDCLAFFDYLLRGFVVSQIKRKFGLSLAQCERYLSKLEKLDLIDWLPRNRIVLRCDGEPEWKPHGPLAQRLRGVIFEDFMKASTVRSQAFLLHDFLPADQKVIQSKIEDVIDFASQCHRRAKASQEVSNPTGIFLAMKEFRWSLDQFLLQKSK
jgi:transcriptional regulator with XRE-family HTH domain